MRFSKGHGTENDFVVLPDPDGELDLTAARVAALCDRRRGLGADGVLRVVRWKALPGTTPEPGVEWFMDYRNADGSVAEMCGNGVRVFAHYVRSAGLVAVPEFAIGTRAGLRSVAVAEHGEVSVGMGPATIGGSSVAGVGAQELPGVAVDVGNPHLVCVTDTPLDRLDLTHRPTVDDAMFPHGVNVEFVSPLVAETVGMRVHERGVGETRSCGTGTVAAVAASLHLAGRTHGTVAVSTPGGPLRVTVDGAGTTLHGPAVLVAEGELSDEWWRALG